MANKKSSRKRIRQTIKKNQINSVIRSSCRTAVKKVRGFADSKDVENAKKAFLVAESRIAKAVNKGIYHKNTAARTVSRLNKLVASL